MSVSFDMGSLKPVALEDRAVFESFNLKYKPASCERCFMNIFSRREVYDFRWTIWSGRLITWDADEDFIYMPYGGDGEPSAAEIINLAKSFISGGKSGRIMLAETEWLARNPEINEFFKVCSSPDEEEYIFSAESLTEFPGHKLNKKRKHVEAFKRENPGWRVSPLGADNSSACVELARAWAAVRGESEAEEFNEELAAMKICFDLQKELGVEGVVLESEPGKIAAFSIHSNLTDEMSVNHYEKSDLSVRGAAQTVNFESARFIRASGRTLINKEQDLGLPGLRQAKLSYQPVSMLRNNVLFPR